MTATQWSVEEYIRNFGVNDQDLQTLLAVNGLTNPSSNEYDDPTSMDSSNWSGLQDFTDIDINAMPQVVKKDELDLYLPKHITSCDIKSEFDYSSFLSDCKPPIFNEFIKEQPEPILKTSPLPLSESVGVTIPHSIKNKSHRIEIAYDLELEFKGRYKSDYFSQEGVNRKPRYVADRHGNHFVTLRVQPGLKGYVRVDWTTTEIEQGIRYSMPYKFQVENDSMNVPDVNPLYIKFEADATGELQLFLVLIKAKQDELKSVQALESFPPVENKFNVQNKKSKQLTPMSGKELIRKYQLDKSQLAFTYCSSTPNGQVGAPEWDTTVYSTVMTETSASAAKKRKICCPKCKTHFEITLGKVEDIADETVNKRRKKSIDEKKKQSNVEHKKIIQPVTFETTFTYDQYSPAIFDDFPFI